MTGQHMHRYEGHALFLLVVVFLVIYLLLTFFNPEFVQRDNDNQHSDEENDQAKTFLWSLVILALIVLALWILWYAFSCAW